MAKHFVSVLIIITKELWDRCQEQKALNNFNNRPGHVANDLFVLQGLIRCGTTNSICTCERKKKKYNYIFCYREDKTRVYIPEHIILDKITEILERIRLPEHVMTEMKEDLKKIKSKEKAYCKQETAKLKQDMEELKKKMDHLFDLRLEGEIEREMFDAKRMDLELKIGRVQDKIIAHEKADNRFNETILDLLDISKEAKNIFLGDMFKKLTIDLLLLSPEEQDARIEQTRVAIINKEEQNNKLEEEASQLTAYGDYVLKEIQKAKDEDK